MKDIIRWKLLLIFLILVGGYAAPARIGKMTAMVPEATKDIATTSLLGNKK